MGFHPKPHFFFSLQKKGSKNAASTLRRSGPRGKHSCLEIRSFGFGFYYVLSCVYVVLVHKKTSGGKRSSGGF
jgi:hypothetical protein